MIIRNIFFVFYFLLYLNIFGVDKINISDLITKLEENDGYTNKSKYFLNSMDSFSFEPSFETLCPIEYIEYEAPYIKLVYSSYFGLSSKKVEARVFDVYL